MCYYWRHIEKDFIAFKCQTINTFGKSFETIWILCWLWIKTTKGIIYRIKKTLFLWFFSRRDLQYLWFSIFSKIKLNFLNFKEKCFLNGKCESYSIELNDTEVNSFGGKLYVSSQSETANDSTLRMRRFSLTKQIVSVKEHGLQTFQYFNDGFEYKVCDQTFKLLEINAL